MYKRLFVGAAVAASFAAMLPAQTQAQNKPIRIITGFPAGSSSDSLARFLAQKMQTALDRNVIVENKAGATGRIAVEYVKSAAPDGDTLLIAPQGPMTLFPYTFRNLRYDPERDFTPIAVVAAGDFAFVAGPGAPVKDIASAIRWLKTPGVDASYATSGAGSLTHFAGVSIARALGVQMTMVPYKGAVAANTDLVAGRIPLSVAPVADVMELAKAGRLTILATTSAERSPFLPDVPTLKESGIDVDVNFYYALYAPAGLAPALQEKLRAVVATAMATPEPRERLAAMTMAPSNLGADQLAAAQKREYEMWGPIVKASGFSAAE